MSRKPFILIAIFALSALARADEPKSTPGQNLPAVYFLLDEKAVHHCGHAALLVGDKQGWDYYSFGPRSQDQVVKNNLVHHHYDSLAAACSSQELGRYTKHLSWTTSDERVTAAIRLRVRKVWDNSSYDPLKRNCFTMVGDAIQTGFFMIDITSPVPVTAYKANEGKAKSRGSWPVCQP